MTVDHEVSSGDDGAASAGGIAQTVIKFAMCRSRTGEAVSAR